MPLLMTDVYVQQNFHIYLNTQLRPNSAEDKLMIFFDRFFFFFYLRAPVA